MILVSPLMALVQQLSFVMTVPTFTTFVTVLTRWVFARRRTVTGMIVAEQSTGSSLNRKPINVSDAGNLIMTEAGGRMTDIAGQDSDLFMNNILASNGTIHDDTLQVTRKDFRTHR